MSTPDARKMTKAEDKAVFGETKIPQNTASKGTTPDTNADHQEMDLDDTLAQMEAIFEQVKSAQPRLETEEEKSSSPDSARVRRDDLEALLDISKAINSTLVLDDILQMVMRRASKLLRAERGFLMLLDEEGTLQFKTAHNISKESLSKEDFRISMSIANNVAKTGKSTYTSDAQHDERYSKQKSIVELDLKSIMCVPLKSKEKIIGILYLDNSSKSNIFLQSDLYLFELFASQAAIAIENAKLYENLLSMKIYNENVVNKTPVGIVVVDNNLKITIANRASQEIFKKTGWSEDLHRPLRNLFLLDLFPAEEKARWKKICYQVLYTGEPFEEAKSYHKFQSEEIALSLKVSPLNSHDNRILGLIIVIEDITEKVIAEKYLIYSQNLVVKGEMAAYIGHELNNYLTIIMNNAELLSLNLNKGELVKSEKNVKAIQENVERMKRFTEGMVDFSKLETKITEYDLRILIEDLIFSLKPQELYSRISFQTSFDPSLSPLPMDVGQIQQVLLNLFNNAAEAMNTPPTSHAGILSITTAYVKREEIAEIKITDNGPGIPAELLSKIFEPHFTTKTSGHGFGLVICEKIVKNHHGKIFVESSPAGTTFTINLPMIKE